MLRSPTLAAAALVLGAFAAVPPSASALPAGASAAPFAAGNWTTTGQRLPADQRCTTTPAVQVGLTLAGKTHPDQADCASSGYVTKVGRRLP